MWLADDDDAGWQPVCLYLSVGEVQCGDLVVSGCVVV